MQTKNIETAFFNNKIFSDITSPVFIICFPSYCSTILLLKFRLKNILPLYRKNDTLKLYFSWKNIAYMLEAFKPVSKPRLKEGYRWKHVIVKT